MNRQRIIAIIEAICAVVIWGATFVATKVAISYVSPNTVVWLRFAMGVAILGGATLARKQFRLPTWKDAGYFALVGFIGITFHQWLQSTGLLTSQATTTSWIVATTPIFMALFGWLFLKEKLDRWQMAGVVLAALGVLLVVSKGDLRALSSGRFGSVGDILILISAPNWAVFSILSRSGLKRFPSSLMMFYVMLFGWLFTSVLFVANAGVREIGSLPLPGWIAVLVLGVFGSGLSYVFWYDALQALPVAQAGAFVYMEPFVTVIVAALVLSEPLLVVSLAGGGLILAGVWLVNRVK